MNEKSPQIKITVLLPVYNGEKYLAEAIESILNQTYKNFEFLIINDGSTDSSVKIIESYNDPRIRLIHNEKNIRIISTLNKGIHLARGEYIARMDCDDISLSNRLEMQVAYLDKHSEVGILGGGVQIIDEKKNIISESIRPLTHFQNKWKLLFGTTLLHPTVMYRKHLIAEHGGYSHDFIHCEDYDLWSRLCESAVINQIPDVLLLLRKHDHNIGVLYKDISSENFIKISIQNILNLSSKYLDFNKVSQVIRWFHGEKLAINQQRNICKTLLAIYFQFISIYQLTYLDRRWITNSFINIITPALFKMDIFSQLRVWIQGFKFCFLSRNFAMYLYLMLIRKYISSLIS